MPCACFPLPSLSIENCTACVRGAAARTTSSLIVVPHHPTASHERSVWPLVCQSQYVAFHRASAYIFIYGQFLALHMRICVCVALVYKWRTCDVARSVSIVRRHTHTHTALYIIRMRKKNE